MIDFAKLKEPFPPSKVSWRVSQLTKDGKKARALAYIDARDVMQRLDDVCEPQNWEDEYPHIGATTVCKISIRDGEHMVSKCDGAGSTDIEAEKGQLSDAFKRCAVKWGIGRYLYDMPAPWVAIDQFKHILPSELERLAGMLPNADTNGVKVNGMHGLSKEPAKFWKNASLRIPLTNKFTAEVLKNKNIWTPEVMIWWETQFKNAVDKAPTRDLLAKLQTDNQEILDSYTSEKTHELYEACSVRATQFDQMEGMNGHAA